MGQNTLNNTKWSQKRGNRIVELLKQGKFKTHACAMIGIDVKTLYNWIELSEKGEHGPKSKTRTWPGFQGFHFRVREADAEFCGQMESDVRTYGWAGKNPDWKAIAWLLEKKFPGMYGEAAKKVELSGKVQVGMDDLIRLIDEDEAKNNDNGNPTEDSTA